MNVSIENKANSADELRRQAAAMIKEDDSQSQDELRRTIYELRVYQIELKMQNEELRRVQLELNAAMERYFEIYDLAPVGYCRLNLQGLILQANFTAASLLGVPRGELIHQPLARYIFNEDQDTFYLYQKQLSTTDKVQSCELQMVKNDGANFWAQLAMLAVTDNDGTPELRVVLSDISERKQAELYKQETETFKQAIFNALSDEIAVIDHDGVILAVNDAWQRFPKEASVEPGKSISGAEVGDNYLLACQNASAKEAYDGIRAVLDRWTHSFSLEYPCHTPQQQRWFVMSVTPMGEAEAVILHKDISGRKQVELALGESEYRYRTLFQNTREAILIADMNAKLEEINSAGERLLGYTRDEIIGKNALTLHPADQRCKVSRHFEEISKNGIVEPIETKILCRNASIVAVEIRPSLIEINCRKLVQGVFIDLTERRRVEDQRLATENSYRELLIREVHHRIKNNLQGITGLLRSFAASHPESEDLLNQVISQVQSISVIHGLQGRAVGSTVRACELTVAIAAGLETQWHKPVIVDIPDGWIPSAISQTEAVPVALILNELILNALKHGQSPVSIAISHQPNPLSIKLAISNVGLIPFGFGLDNPDGFGTGLQLVYSLLPKTGVRLTWEQQGSHVVTTLSLDEPLIQIDSSLWNTDER